MGLFGSLFTGVSALAAQSQATSMISNNIANVNTTGFKRSEAAFYSLVTTQSRSARYSPGSVTTTRLQRVDQQGPLQQSSSSTDAAISGNGFFVVKQNSDDSALDSFYYTRNGQFAEDAEGYLVNSAGYYLYGWPIDSVGDIQGGETEANLTPVSVGFATGQAIATTRAELAINLNGQELDVDRTTALTDAADFSRTLTVYDEQGTPQSLVMNFVKTYGPQATIGGSVADLTYTTSLITGLGLTDGDEFELDIDGATQLVYEISDDGIANGAGTAIQTVGDLVNDINNNVAGVSAYIGNNGELIIQRDSFIVGGESLTVTNDPNATNTGSDTINALFGTVGTMTDTSTDLDNATYDNGTPPDYDGEIFPAFNITDPTNTGFNSRGWWQMEILDGNNNLITNGMLNFAPDGSLNALPNDEGNIGLNLTNIDWGNGSTAQTIFVDLEQLAQSSSNYTTFYTDQDGAELGLRTGLSINSEGYVVAQFSNGSTAQLYRVPLATFSNANGLQEQNGTAYVENDASGTVNLRLSGEGGAGTIQNSALENSNVDLADEFAKLIISQRAFGAGTKVITTVDQMTEELLRLR